MFHLARRVPLLARAFLAYKWGSETVRYPPLHLWIDPTDICNLQCIMCPTQREGVRDKGHMEFDLFRKIMDEAQDAFPVVNLYMSGESLIHKDIYRMIDCAAERNAATCLYTNATLLNEKRCASLLDSKLDWLGFSFDGYDEEMYEQVRVGARFDKTVGNIERFLAMRRERGQKRPHTFLSLIELEGYSKDTPPEIKEAFKTRLREAGLDQFDVTEAHNWAGQVNEFVQVQVPGRDGARNEAAPGDGDEAPPAAGYTRCPAPWTMMAILWDGVAVPCCLDTAAKYPLGNVGEHRVMEIFNGQRMQELRRAMAGGQARDIELCSGCEHLNEKQFLGIPKKVWLEVRDNIKAAMPKLGT